MRYNKNPDLRGMKKKEFPQNFEFLSDIVGKCILCKDSAHNSVSDLQLRVITTIVLKIKVQFGSILLERIGRWMVNAGKRKASRKQAPKMFHMRFIIILLKNLLMEIIGDKEGESLNVNQNITPKLFKNWNKCPARSFDQDKLRTMRQQRGCFR